MNAGGIVLLCIFSFVAGIIFGDWADVLDRKAIERTKPNEQENPHERSTESK